MTTVHAARTLRAIRPFQILAASLLLSLAAVSTAHAEATASAKAATGVENRLPVGEGSKFKKGEAVYVWSEVKDADEQTVEHVWKLNGKEFRRAHFPVHSKSWKVNSRVPRAAAGSYVVEVVIGDKVIGQVAFTVE